MRGIRRSTFSKWAVAVALATAVPCAAGIPLEQAIDTGFFQSDPWKDGKVEVTRYEGSSRLNGTDTPVTAVSFVTLTETNREFMTRAEWPWGNKPLIGTVSHRMIIESTSDDRETTPRLSRQVLLGRTDPGRALRVQSIAEDWRGITTRDLQRYGPQPRFLFSSPKEGEGVGSIPLPEATRAWTEEELPLVLRAVRFRPDLEADFLLLPAPTGQGAPPPRAISARLTTSRHELGWRIDVATELGQRITYDVDDSPYRTMTAISHSEGINLRMTNSVRRAEGSPR